MLIRRLLYILPLFILVGVAALIFLRVQDSDPNAADSVDYHQRAVFERTLPLLGDASPIDTVRWLQDQDSSVTVVNFFASWCVPCRAEHPYLMEASAGGDFHLVGIGHKDTPENLQRFLDDLGDPYRSVLVDEDGRAGIDWGLNGVPETFVVVNGTEVVGKIKGPLLGEPTLRRFDALLQRAQELAENRELANN